jgi:hypothetical protein
LIELRPESSDNPPRGSSAARTRAALSLAGTRARPACVVVSATGYAFLPERFSDYALGTHALDCA